MSQQNPTLNALQETRSHLVERAEMQLYRNDIRALEAALGDVGYRTRLQETSASGGTYSPGRQLTPDFYANEAGWGQFGSIGGQASPDDRLNGRDSLMFRTIGDLRFMRQIGRWYTNYDEVGIALRDNVTNYVAGDRIRYAVEPRKKGQDEKLCEVLQDFVDLLLEENKWVGVREKVPIAETFSDGEQLLLLDVSDELPVPEIRIESTDHLTEPDKEAESLDRRLGETYLDWSFGIGSRPGRPGKAKGYYLDWYGQGDFQLYPASRVVMPKINSHEDVKRGVSDIYAEHRSLGRAAKGMESTSKQAAIQSTIAYIEELAQDTPEESVNRALQTPGAIARTLIDSMGRSFTAETEGFMGGKVIRTAGTKYHMGPMGTPSGVKLVEVFQAVLRRVAVRHNFPEWMASGDASNNNMASSVVAESPMHKSTLTNQGRWAGWYVELIWKAIELAISVGQLPGVPRDVAEIKKRVRLIAHMPDPSERDKLEEETIREMQHNARVLSVRTWRSQVGLDDETEQANFEEEDKAEQERMAKTGEIPGMGPVRPGGPGDPVRVALMKRKAEKRAGAGKPTAKASARESVQSVARAIAEHNLDMTERRELATAILYGDAGDE